MSIDHDTNHLKEWSTLADDFHGVGVLGPFEERCVAPLPKLRRSTAMSFTRRARLSALLLVFLAAIGHVVGSPTARATTATVGPINTAVIFANMSDSATPIDVNGVRANINGS